MATNLTTGRRRRRPSQAHYPFSLSATATLLAALLLASAPARGLAARHLRAASSYSHSSNGPQSPQVAPPPPDFVEATPVASPGTTAGGLASETAMLEKDAVQFIGPRVKGYPLDFCSRYSRGRGSGCGQEAADLWCRAHGFRAASQFLTTHYAPNATWALGDGTVNPADPDDRDSAVGQHTYFVNITCVATLAAAGPGAEEEEVEVGVGAGWGPRAGVDGEMVLAAPVPAAVGGAVTEVERAGDGGLKEAGDAQGQVMVEAAAVAEKESSGSGGS